MVCVYSRMGQGSRMAHLCHVAEEAYLVYRDNFVNSRYSVGFLKALLSAYHFYVVMNCHKNYIHMILQRKM